MVSRQLEMDGVPPYPPALFREYQKKGWWLGVTIAEAFDRTCDIYPEKVAVVEGQQRLTFSELRERTLRAALALGHLGIGRGDRVLLQVPNWIEAIYIYLGLQRVGAVPVLCLPRHGQRELETFCTLTQARAWLGPARLGQTDYMPMVKALKAKFSSMEHVIVVRDEAPPGTVSFSRLMADTRLDKSSAKRVHRFRPSPHQVIQLAPTGGTTGLPKLVPKTHNDHLTKAYYFARTLELGPREVGLVFAPLNHDAPQLLNLCFTILFGGTTVLCPSTRAGDILEHIEREKVTYCFFVPALLADVLHSPDLERRDLSSLRTIATGGAHCPAELVKLALSRLKCCFHNTYGMTEGAGTVTRSHDSVEVVAQTVGKRICPYDEYRIVDEAGDEVPAGQEGELATRGPCMVSGYYKSEADNKLVFTADAFFRTGDLARFDKEGNLIITGRRKDIINRGGDKV
ncbi:MAG: AMP-binding protein, partial [Dehalococcoidia bacterium]